MHKLRAVKDITSDKCSYYVYKTFVESLLYPHALVWRPGRLALQKRERRVSWVGVSHLNDAIGRFYSDII